MLSSKIHLSSHNTNTAVPVCTQKWWHLPTYSSRLQAFVTNILQTERCSENSKAPCSIYPDPSKDRQMFHCTSHLNCISFPGAVCFRVTSEKGQAMGPCYFFNSSVSTLKKKKRHLERKFVRPRAVASSFLALSECTAASERKSSSVLSVLWICIYTAFFSSPHLGLHPQDWEELSLSSSCAAGDRLVWLLPALLWSTVCMQEALKQHRAGQEPFTAWQS